MGEPLMHTEVPTDGRRYARASLLDRFNIQPAAGSRNHPHAFSGGMKQRAMVAMGISAGASVILADEPTKGLDERRVAQVRDAFLSLTEQAVLCVTHDLDFAGAIADDIHVMYAGQQVESGPAEALLHHPLHPYTQDMVAARPENGLQVTGGFAPSHTDVVEGCPYRARCRFADSRCATAPNVEVSVGHTVVLEPCVLRRGLTKRYTIPGGRRGGFYAVDDADVVIAAGETVGLLGDSGSGKTTLGMMIAGLTRPTSGTIRYEGRPLAFPYRGELRRQIQILFQHPEVLQSGAPDHPQHDRALQALRPAVHEAKLLADMSAMGLTRNISNASARAERR